MYINACSGNVKSGNACSSNLNLVMHVQVNVKSDKVCLSNVNSGNACSSVM